VHERRQNRMQKRFNVRIPVQDYKLIHVTVIICATRVNIHTRTQTDRRISTSYIRLAQHRNKLHQTGATGTKHASYIAQLFADMAAQCCAMRFCAVECAVRGASL